MIANPIAAKIDGAPETQTEALREALLAAVREGYCGYRPSGPWTAATQELDHLTRFAYVIEQKMPGVGVAYLRDRLDRELLRSLIESELD